MKHHPSVINSHILDSTTGSTAFTTYEGHIFDIFDPGTWLFDLSDISHALSTTCRYGGHVEFYSVAEHSVRVAKWLEDQGHDVRTQLLGLMHDSVEAYIGDIVRPIKKHADLGGESVLDLEKGMEYALFASFDLLDDQFDDRWTAVKQGDMAVYAMERDERPSPGRGLSSEEAKSVFLKYFYKLTERLEDAVA